MAELIAEKQAKMQKLSKCKGTTKKLKIAGLSTLGISAVGVVTNVAEAVALKKAKNDLEDAQSDAIKALCEGNNGLKGKYDSINQVCTVKEEPGADGITCKNNECSSDNIKVKIKVVKTEPIVPTEESAPAENTTDEALCNDEKGLNGKWNSTDKICTVKQELFNKLPNHINCNNEQTECSSGDIKVKIKVEATPAEEDENKTTLKGMGLNGTCLYYDGNVEGKVNKDQTN